MKQNSLPADESASELASLRLSSTGVHSDDDEKHIALDITDNPTQSGAAANDTSAQSSAGSASTGVSRPGIFASLFHWSRLCILFFLLLSVGLTVVFFTKPSVGIPTIAVAVIFFLAALLALGLSWNYAVSHSLAESAAKLEGIYYETVTQLEIQKRNNNITIRENGNLEKNNTELSDRLIKFTESVSLLGGSIRNMESIEKKIREILSVNQEIQKRRTEIAIKARKFLTQQSLDELDRQKEDMKRRVRDLFDEADTDRDGYIDGEKEIGKLRLLLKRIAVTVDENKWDSDGDGKVEKYELMDALDTALDQHYDAMKNTILDKEKEFQKQEQNNPEETSTASIHESKNYAARTFALITAAGRT